MGYMGLQVITRGDRKLLEVYRELQGVTGCYKGVQGVTGGYKGVQGVIRGYTRLQGVTGGYRRFQGVTGYVLFLLYVLYVVVGLFQSIFNLCNPLQQTTGNDINAKI